MSNLSPLRPVHNATVVAQASISADLKSPQPAEISAHQSADQAVKRGVVILLLTFAIFVIWASLAPLDEGVPVEAKVTVEQNNVVIQHLYGGIVDQLNVHEGQMVKQGDLLLTLDAASSKARFEEIRQLYLSLRAKENRLLSEKNNQATITFHPDVVNASTTDAQIKDSMRDQQQLLAARRGLLQADLNQLNQAIRAEHEAITTNGQVLKLKQSELALIQQQSNNIQAAVNEGFVTRQQSIDLQQRAAQMQGEIANAQGAIDRAKQSIASLQSKITARIQAERKEIEENLAQVRSQVNAEADKVKSLQNDLTRTQILAPVDGQVMELQIHSNNTVVNPSQHLMSVVPANAHLLLDAKIPSHLIDRVNIGQTADIRFNGFAHTPELKVDGKVISLSEDIISEANERMPTEYQYYLARVEISQQGMQTLGDRVLKPGMPVQIVINTGERTLMDYLLHPLTKRFSAALKEE